MSDIQKSIDRAIKYVDNSKKYTLGCKIIDELIKSLKTYLKTVEVEQSKLELENFECALLKKENERLLKIIEIYGGNADLSEDQIQILDDLKERSQYYCSSSPEMILFKHKFIDVVLSAKMPNKETRPTTISQVEEAYKILSQKYANS